MAPGLRRLLRQPRPYLDPEAVRTASKPVDSPLARDRLVRAARQWAWLLVLTVGFVLFVVVNDAYQSNRQPEPDPLAAAARQCRGPGRLRDLHRQPPDQLRRARADGSPGRILGGVTGVVAASLIEYQTLSRLGTLPLVAVGAIEESVKRWRRPEC